MLDVCICTHNPETRNFRNVIAALANQGAAKHVFRVLVVDNASTPPVSSTLLQPLREKGVPCRVVFEPRLGLSSARLKAISETRGDWVLFVDDDNELERAFIATGLAFIAQSPKVGCFGGKLILPGYLNPPQWALPFLPYLGIRDDGDDVISNYADEWGPWEPAGAGAWVHRRVLNSYMRISTVDSKFYELGRKGKSGLASCDDSLLMRSAFRAGLECAYVPQLNLVHHLHPRRFRFSYLIRLMSAYGRSHVILDTLLKGHPTIPPYLATTWGVIKLLRSSYAKGAAESIPFGIGQVFYHLASWLQLNQLNKSSSQNISNEVSLENIARYTLPERN